MPAEISYADKKIKGPVAHEMPTATDVVEFRMDLSTPWICYLSIL